MAAWPARARAPPAAREWAVAVVARRAVSQQRRPGCPPPRPAARLAGGATPQGPGQGPAQIAAWPRASTLHTRRPQPPPCARPPPSHRCQKHPRCVWGEEEPNLVVDEAGAPTASGVTLPTRSRALAHSQARAPQAPEAGSARVVDSAWARVWASWQPFASDQVVVGRRSTANRLACAVGSGERAGRRRGWGDGQRASTAAHPHYTRSAWGWRDPPSAPSAPSTLAGRQTGGRGPRAASPRRPQAWRRQTIWRPSCCSSCCSRRRQR